MASRVNVRFRVSADLVTVDCNRCGIVFAVPVEFDQARLEDHQTWHCPSGHGQCYIAETEAEKLRKQIASIQGNLNYYQELTRRRDAEVVALSRSNSALKGVNTRMTNRVKNGVCPFCHRHFDGLQRHMTSKHKNEKAEP